MAKKKFVLMGQAVAYKKIVDFVERIKQGMEDEKNKSEEERQHDKLAGGGSGGNGAVESFLDQLESALKLIEEEISIEANGAILEAERGRLTVDGAVAIDNHADILKILTMWLGDNRPKVMEAAVDGIAKMIRSGTAFRTRT